MGLFKGLNKIFEIIYNEAEREILDETPYMEALDDLFLKLKRGEITEAEYDEEETEILEQLSDIRKYKKENGIKEE